MSTSTQIHATCGVAVAEVRSKLLMRRTMQAIRACGLNVLKFASRVAEQYNSIVPQFERCVQFYDAGSTLESALDAERANGKLVDRFIKGVVKFPADLEEAWVDALPEPFRSDLIRELAWRYGLIGAKLPALQHHEHIARLADVLIDAGQTAQSLAPMFASGKLDLSGESGARIEHSTAVILRAIGDLRSLHEQIVAQLRPARPDDNARQPARTRSKRRR